MKEITNNWRSFLLSETKDKHYEVEILLKYSPDMSLYGSVFNKIRAIPGVTIVKRKEEDYLRSFGDNKVVVLNVKFIPPTALMARYLQMLKSHLQNLKDEEGDKVVSVRYVSAPSELDS